MKNVDRYITYYKYNEENDTVDMIEFDKLEKKFDVIGIADALALYSEDEEGNYFVEIELPTFIFDVLKAKITGETIKKINISSSLKERTIYDFICSKSDNYYQLLIDTNNFIYIVEQIQSQNDDYEKYSIDSVVFFTILEGLKEVGCKKMILKEDENYE